ncbi:MAG: PQQ-binding-like beta-propeller repeat protein, partial [Firmicutes bacterium]|nr:PQQ-binding-like beta-propeller repeat protein [Bacillota bacterium]
MSGKATVGSDSVTVGNYTYVHLTKIQVRDNQYVKGIIDDPNNPTLLGYIKEDHLHLQMGNVAQEGPFYNPLGYLGGPDNFTDDLSPTVSQITFFPSDIETTSERVSFTGPLFNKVDIRAKCRDSRQFDSRIRYSGIYRIEFLIEDGEGNDIYGPVETIRFDQVMPPDNGDPVKLIYDVTIAKQANSDTFHYWVTNAIINNQVENRYWNTKLRDGEEWNGLDARINWEAKFKDGKYKVSVLAYDYKGNGGKLDEQKGAETKEITIDNFRPIVRRITIGTNYEGEWKLSENGLIFSKNFDTSLKPGIYTITVEFSEPVKNPTMSIDTFGVIPLQSSDQIHYSGALVIPENDETHHGIRTITVNAVDLNDNALLQLSPGMSIIDSQQLTRDINGVMQGIGGSDTIHQFIIGDGPQIDLTCTGLPHGPANITYTVTDEDLESIALTVDDTTEDVPVLEGETTKTGTKEVDGKGEHKVIVTAVDKAKNPPSQKKIEFVIDPSPQIALTHSGPPCGPVMVSYTVTDKDLETITLTVNEKPTPIPVEGRTTVSGTQIFTDAGDYTVTLSATASDGPDHKGEKTIKFTIKPKPPRPTPTPPPPGGEPPARVDESYDVSGSHYGPMAECPISETKVGILQTGYWNDMKAFFNSIGYNAELIPPEEFSPDLMRNQKSLFVPTGGLFPLSNLPEIEVKLAEYLEAGGTVVVFAQTKMEDYNIIPGPVTGLGYVEDTACHSLTGAITKYLPCFAGQRDTTVDGNADGILTGWPENAEVWLRRIKNGYPALISYPYGQGRVIVSTYYTDFAYGHSQLNEDERRLFRDLLAWTTAPNQEIPEVKPGGSIALNVPITADASIAANPGVTKIRLLVRDPDSRLVETQEYEMAMGPGQTVEIPYLFDSTGKVISSDEKGLGIWSINYELLAEDAVVQSERAAVRVAISKHLEGSDPAPLAATVVMPTSVPYTEQFPVQLQVVNSDQRERTIRYTIQGGISPSHFIHGTITVPANSTRTVEETGKALWYCTDPANPIWVLITFRDESNRVFARELRQIYAHRGEAIVEYTFLNLTRPDHQDSYGNPAVQAGDRVRISAVITDQNPTYDRSYWHFKCKGSSGSIIYQEDFEHEVGSAGSFTKTFEFIVPRCNDDRFSLSITGEKGGAPLVIGTDSKDFFVQNKSNYEFTLLRQAADGELRLRCRQKGPGSVGGKVSCYLNKCDSSGYLGEIDIPELEPGSFYDFSITVDPGIHFGTGSAGNILYFRSSEDVGTVLGRLALTRLTPAVSLSGWNGRAGSTLQIKTSLVGGPVSAPTVADLRLRVPDLGFVQNLACEISPANNPVEQVISVEVPSSMGPGVYPVILEAVQGDRVLYSAGTTMKINNAEINAEFLGPDPVRAGETVSWRLVNTGGSMTTAEFRFNITTINSPQISQELLLPLDSPQIVSVELPADITSGIYRLAWELRDKRTGLPGITWSAAVTVQGVTATVRATTDKDYYLTGEPVVAEAEVQAGSLPVAGKLHLEVRHAVEGGYEAAWPTRAGGLDRRNCIQGLLGFEKPGYRWKSSHRMGSPLVGQVLPGGGRQVVATEGDYDGWNQSVVIRDASTGNVLKVIEPSSYISTTWYNLPIEPADMGLIDLDGDGIEEIVFYVIYMDGTYNNTCLVALSAQDGVRWKNLLIKTPYYNPAVDLALSYGDYDGDGKIEVFAASSDKYYLLDGESGQVRQSLPAHVTLSGNVARLAQADLNLDGSPELVLCSSNHCICLASDLSLLWSTELPGEHQYWNDIAVADLDNDGMAEVVVSANGGLAVLAGATGQIRWERFFNETTNWRSLAVGDSNRDGMMEIFVATYSTVRAFTYDGNMLWSYNRSGPITLITQADRAFILIGIQRDLDCLDAASGQILWSYYGPYYSSEKLAVADVEGDGRLEVVGSHGCLDAYEPAGAVAPMPESTAGIYSEVFRRTGRPWVAGDGSLWHLTQGGFSYYDPFSGRFGSIPYRIGEDYALVNTEEGLTLFCWNEVLGYVDLGAKAFIESWRDDPEIISAMEQFYYHNDGWLNWMDANYLWFDNCFYLNGYAEYTDLQGEGGILGVGPDGTAFALVNGEIWGWNFATHTLTGPFPSPVKAARGFAGAVQLTTELAFVPIPSAEYGLALYRFNPVTMVLEPLLTEDELKAAFAAAAGSQPVDLNLSLVHNPESGGIYVCLGDGVGLPYLFLYDPVNDHLIHVGAFVGQGVAIHPRIAPDGSLMRLVPGAQPRIEKLLPAGGRILIELPREIAGHLAEGDCGASIISPAGEYCILTGGMLYRIAPSGEVNLTALEATKDWTIYEMGFGSDPDLLYLYVNRNEPRDANIWLMRCRLSTGEFEELAYLGHSHLFDFVMYEYHVPGLLADGENGKLYFNRSERLPDLDREQLALWIYEPGLGERMIGYWSGVNVWSDQLTLLCKKGNLIYLLDADYSLWAMDLATGRSWLAGQMDLEAGPFAGAFYNPTNDLIYLYDYDFTLWSWDFFLHGPAGTGGGVGTVREEVVWAADYRVDLAAGAVDTRTATIEHLPPGQYRLEATLRTDRGQLVGRDQHDFTVVQDNLAGLLEMPAGPIKVNTTVPITASVVNLSPVVGQDVEAVLSLLLEGGEATELQRVTFHLAPGESRKMQVDALFDRPGKGLVRLELRREGNQIGTFQGPIFVAAPQVEAGLEAPAEVGRTPFKIRAWVRNTGLVGVELILAADLLELFNQPVTLAPGEERIFEKEIALSGDALFRLQIQGDCALERTASILMAESIHITAEVLDVYPDGLVAPAVVLKNTGRLPTSFQLELTLTKAGQVLATTSHDVNLGVGSSARFALPHDLPPGSYLFSWHTPLGSGDVPFEVKQGYAATLAASCREEGAFLSVDINISNLGLLGFTGRLEAVVGGEQAWREVTLASGETLRTTIQLPLPHEAGVHQVEGLFLADGVVLAATTTSYVRQTTISPVADIKVVSVPQNLVLGTGEERTVEIGLRNDGLQVGEVLVVLDCDDFLNDGQVVTVVPGEERTVQFNLVVPEDRESGVYTAKVMLDGREVETFQYEVEGIKLQVVASTDKQAYVKGDNIVLSLQVTQIEGGDNLPLKAVVIFGEFEESREFDLNGTETLNFNIPATYFGQKLFYGFYHRDTERSLYLDTMYIYEDYPQVLIITDKQLYQAGDNVLIQLVPHQEGWIFL